MPSHDAGRYREVYRAAFDYHMKHLAAPVNWSAAVKDLRDVAEQLGEDRFVFDLLNAVLHDLERRDAEERAGLEKEVIDA